MIDDLDQEDVQKTEAQKPSQDRPLVVWDMIDRGYPPRYEGSKEIDGHFYWRRLNLQYSAPKKQGPKKGDSPKKDDSPKEVDSPYEEPLNFDFKSQFDDGSATGTQTSMSIVFPKAVYAKHGIMLSV